MRNILSLILTCILCTFLVGCSAESDSLSENSNTGNTVTVPKTVTASLGSSPEIALSIGDSYTVAFKVSSPTQITAEELIPVVINSDLLDIEFQRFADGYAYYTVTAKAEGTTQIYLELAGSSVRSENIKFTVRNNAPDYIVGALGEGSFSLIDGRTKEICFAVLGYDFAPEDIQIVVENSDIVKATYRRVSGCYAYYVIEALAPGSTSVYVETVDGSVKSPSVTVAVVEKGTVPEGDEVIEGYIASKNSKTFHLPTCSAVNSIKDGNRLYFDCDRQVLIDDEYTPCLICNP